MSNLPGGTVTLLFTDIEGSTGLLQRLGERYRAVLEEHCRLLRAAFQAHGGHEVDTQGDSFFVAFPRAAEAVAAATAAQRALAAHSWPDGGTVRVRIGLHTGEPSLGSSGYVGLDVHRAARLGAAGHGGQVLLSRTTHDLVEHDLPAGVRLRDLGEHRLKDLQRPEQVYQLVLDEQRADFPPIRSLSVRPNNLPTQLTSFVGREAELAEVRRLVLAARLVTLTGTGGVGKTRLALQAAFDLLEEFPDGVWLVELAALVDPGLLPKSVTAALGLLEDPRRPLIETLTDFLRPRATLLLLDNCEHLVEACAALADPLLRACPRLQILATSRQALGILGETTWRVPSLSLPDSRHLPLAAADLVPTLLQCEAVRLFSDRAMAAQSRFQVTNQNARALAQLCRQLDGIPLALELAAARVRMLSVEQIAARLDQHYRLLTGGSRTALPRQQTLRATVDWSYDLLSVSERVLLRRLSVFIGGWTLEAAESVCADQVLEPGSWALGDNGSAPQASSTQHLTSDQVLDLLSHLVDKSLVVAEERNGEVRYRLLETIRQYGQEWLADAGEGALLRERHLQEFLSLAERAEPELHGPQQAAWFDRLEAEHDNLRAALAWSGSEALGAFARLAELLRWFWTLRGHTREAREQLSKLLALAPDRTAIRAKALLAMSMLTDTLGDFQAAVACADEGLEIWREVGDRHGVAVALTVRGRIAARSGDLDRGELLLQEGQALFRELGGEPLLWLSLPVAFFLAEAAQNRGDDERAQMLYEQSLVESRTRGDQHSVANVLRGLGELALRQGDYARATTVLRESLVLVWELKDVRCSALCLNSLARLAAAEAGRARIDLSSGAERAARLFGAVEAVLESSGIVLTTAVAREAHARGIAAVRAALGDERFDRTWAAGWAMSKEQAVAYALEASVSG